MNKLISKLSVGLIFLMFGFVIITQLNTINRQNAIKSDNGQSPEILIENDQLNKEKEELKKKVDEITLKLQEYENAAAGRTEESSQMLEDLKKTRLIAGLTDVEGEGVLMYITPKTNLFGTKVEGYPIIDFDLLTIVNELYAAGAEAISINDIRLTGNGAIRTAGNGILINGERISPQERVTIKAIGNKAVLAKAVDFQGAIPERLLRSCDVTYEVKDKITINKSTALVEYKHIKEVKEN